MLNLQPVDFDGLLKLFTFREKKQLVAYCRKQVIHSADFVTLIDLCRLPGTLLRYTNHFAEYTPSHLALSREDLRAIAHNGVGPLAPRARKTMRKVTATLVQRRELAGHLFYIPNTPIWHLFVLDQRDLAEGDANHWAAGSHVHLVNWLWPRLNPVDIWQRLRADGDRPRGMLHIRFQMPATGSERRT